MSSTIITLSTHSHFPIQLVSDNFPSWRKQVISTLTSLELEQYVDGSTEPPPKTLEGKPNPAYKLWFRQDQILLGALLGSCSATIQRIVSSAETSRQLFQHLTESYASVSQSRIISLRSKLATNSKGTKPVAEFLREMKAIDDELALAQKPIDDDDLIVHILTQLCDDYKQITAALKIRDTPITFSDLFEKLADHERSLQDSQSTNLIATVNNTQRQGPRSNSRSSFEARNTNRPNSFGPKTNRSHNSNSVSMTTYRTNRNNLFCQFCNIPGHDTKECRKLARFLQDNNIAIAKPSPINPTINSSMASASSTPPLMFDSGASNHAAYDRSFLHTLSEYGGPDEIVLGNGPSKGARLMRGVNVNDVYYAPSISSQFPKQINFSTKITGSLLSWHHKFGHPSIKVLKLLLNKLGLHYNNM